MYFVDEGHENVFLQPILTLLKGYLSFHWTSYLSCVGVKDIRRGEGGGGLKSFAIYEGEKF